MSVSTGLELTDFTAYELPTRRWMKLVHPKIRLRVRVQNREFVSSTIKVCDRSSDGSNPPPIHWPWGDDEQFPRASFADDEVFEVEVERRYLLWYKCIRRTKPVTIDQVRTGKYCALSLYDGRQFAEVPEDRIELGEITFALRSGGSGEDGSSEGRASFAKYSGEVQLAQES